MELQPIRMSARASDILNRHPSFRVKAVFHQVVNLDSPAGAVAVQTSKAAFTPLSIVVDGESLRRMKELPPGSVVSLRAGCGEITNLQISPSPESRLIGQAGMLHKAVSVMAKSDSFAMIADECLYSRIASPTLAQQKARSILAKAELHLKNHAYAQCAETLCELSGLGAGLTPAGDDFLLGALAVCAAQPGDRMSVFRSVLSNYLLASCNKTTWLSSQFFTCAFEGDFSLPIHRVLYAQSKEDLVRAVAEMGAFGHTSGSDTLGGILWMSRAAASDLYD